MSKRYFPDSIGTDTLPTVDSTAALVLPAPSTRVIKERVICYVAGTADITSISATGEAGTVATLIFTGTKATNGVVDGSNLKLSATFAYSPDDTLTLVCDGTNWYQVGSSAN
jgi:hypothetical protein